MPAKRRHAVGKMKRSTSHKTKKRLEVKKQMLADKASKRKKRS
jgi:hypothetical protein